MIISGPKYFGIPSCLILSLGTITSKEIRKAGGEYLNSPDFMLSLEGKLPEAKPMAKFLLRNFNKFVVRDFSPAFVRQD